MKLQGHWCQLCGLSTVTFELSSEEVKMFKNVSSLSTVNKLLTNLTLNYGRNVEKVAPKLQLPSTQERTLFTNTPRCDLTEFFDDKKNWGATEVKSGRSWRKEELRLKSNTDLHKLWYVLLKERNMLLTMEQEAKDQVRLFPSPERLDKVEDSMENLEVVVRERNVAYHQLEIGETGERPGKVTEGPFGLRYYYKMSQYVVPKCMNKKYHESHHFYKPDRDTEKFLLKYREKLYLTKKKKMRRDFNHVIGLMNRFPDMDMEAVKEQYPDVDIEKAKASRKFKGYYVPRE